MSAQALLLVMMEPPATLEEEFNDWYDTEHFSQRRSMPGFTSASRWVCLEGWPRWIALYDLESLDALRTPEYLAVSGSQSTPWSKRILPRTSGRRRVVASGLESAQGIGPETSRLLVMSYPNAADSRALLARARASVATLTDMAHVRGFEQTEEGGSTFWLIVECRAPVAMSALHASLDVLDGHGALVFNLYAPYLRG
jgi:hypothetical protein